MVAYRNFYETVQEARMRLRKTIVKYKDDFYYVIDVCDHMNDGKFRIHMDQLGAGAVGRNRYGSFPCLDDYAGNEMGPKYDKFLEDSPNTEFVRKYADSRHFCKFRPFPLGNMNVGGSVVYNERSPTRNMHQGLLLEAILSTNVKITPNRFDPMSYNKFRSPTDSNQKPIGDTGVDYLCPEFYDMLKGTYPSYDEVVTNLRDPLVMNTGCAFHRDYSVFRGPLDTLILCYKHSGVGMILENNTLEIGSSHEFLLEEIAELNVFNKVTVKKVITND